MRAATCLLLSFVAAGLAQTFVPHLTGEVSRGQEYRKEIGSGLLFLLKPTDSGWMIDIVPKVPCSEEADFARVVNAPYRNYNSLFVRHRGSLRCSISQILLRVCPAETQESVDEGHWAMARLVMPDQSGSEILNVRRHAAVSSER